MSLEEAIAENTATMKQLIAALGGKAAAGGAAASGEKRGPGRPAKADAKPAATKIKPDEVKAAVVNVKETLGTAQAKQIIADHDADDLADLLTKKDQFQSVLDACQAAIDGDGEQAPDEDDL